MVVSLLCQIFTLICQNARGRLYHRSLQSIEFVLRRLFSAWNVAVAFFGLGCAIVRAIGEQEQSKYISNRTAQASISK